MSLVTTTLAQLSEYARPGFWYGLGILTAIYLVFIFVAAMSERRFTRPYAEAASVRPGTPIDSYHAAVNNGAAAARFLYGGTFQHRRYDVRVSLWISPDRHTLIEAGAGTSDHYGEGDPSGLIRFDHHYNGSLDNLLALHSRRIGSAGGPPIPFDEPSPLDALNGIYAQRAERLVRAGRAKWLDDRHDFWRYTLRGSICVCRGFFTQLANALSRFWRRWRPRPGELQGSRPLHRDYPPP